MDILRQIKGSAAQLVETLEEGWTKILAKSGQALTRFTRRGEGAAEDQENLQSVESWGMLAGEVAETDSHVIVRLEAPGMEKDDFEIRFENGMLLVRGEKRLQREERNASYHLFEAAYGAFERVLPLPREVDPDGAEATYSRGILCVRLPKTGSRKVQKIRVT